MKYCNNCGAQCDPNDKICRYCGFPLDDSPQTNDWNDPYGYPYPEPPQPEPSRISPAIIIVLVLAVLIVLAVCVFFIFNTTKKADTEVTGGGGEVITGEDGGGENGGGGETEEKIVPQTYNAQLVSSWNMNKNMNQLYSASASSVLPDYNDLTYVPDNVLDNNNRTAWSESKSGTGENEWIALQNISGTRQKINTMYFLDGYTKNQYTFDMNTTPTQLEVSVGNSPSSAEKVADLNMQATISPQAVPLIQPITLNPGEYIVFTIRATSVGPNDDVYDTNISEIYFD